MSRLVVLDNEAVGALADARHPEHRRVLAVFQVANGRKRKAIPISIVVPTAVRVEAGWDRTSPTAAFLNGLAIADEPLDRPAANVAASIRSQLGTAISVADAHIGAVIEKYTDRDITVISSDPGDMRAVAGTKDIVTVNL